MRYFRRRVGDWDERIPALESAEEVPVPKGAACTCGETIAQTDQGVILPTGQALHRECWLRMGVGSIGHLLSICSCYRADGWEDPPGLSQRNAARLVLAWVQTYGPTPGLVRREGP